MFDEDLLPEHQGPSHAKKKKDEFIGELLLEASDLKLASQEPTAFPLRGKMSTQAKGGRFVTGTLTVSWGTHGGEGHPGAHVLSRDERRRLEAEGGAEAVSAAEAAAAAPGRSAALQCFAVQVGRHSDCTFKKTLALTARTHCCASRCRCEEAL